MGAEGLRGWASRASRPGAVGAAPPGNGERPGSPASPAPAWECDNRDNRQGQRWKASLPGGPSQPDSTITGGVLTPELTRLEAPRRVKEMFCVFCSVELNGGGVGQETECCLPNTSFQSGRSGRGRTGAADITAPWDTAGASMPASREQNAQPHGTSPTTSQALGVVLPPHTPGDLTSIIPTVWTMKQTQTGYVTCSITGRSQVPTRLV